MKRRTMIYGVTTAALSAGFSRSADAKYRVAVIGHSGRGNFGHGLDKVWLKIPETTIVGVSDPDEKGLANAKKSLSVEAGYSDYRTMLSEVKADLVAVCPRHPDQHADMILAAIDAGAKGIYVEKPYVSTLAEADRIKAACDKTGTKIAVAHRNRYHPDLSTIDQILNNKGEMKIGKLLEIRGRGKGDRRGGGEDLWVLGTHVLDLISRFSGQPLSCSATMLQGGKLVTAADVKEGNEALGPLAADEIHARYRMENGITAYFDSLANDESKNKGFGLQLIGSDGTVIIHCDARPLAHYREGNPLDPKNQADWQPIGNTDPEAIAQAQNHIFPCRDLIESVEKNRQPICGLSEATTTIEMVMGVFQSHFSGGSRVVIPLENRDHPLANL